MPVEHPADLKDEDKEEAKKNNEAARLWLTTGTKESISL